jgi:ribokinase
VPARVVVVGSINVDVLVSSPRLPAAGETVLGTAVARLPGGKGANQAVALRRLGLDVSLVGAVGGDADGRLSLEALTGVDVSGVRTVGTPTGLALITVDDAGENTIVVVPGANAEAVAPAALEADAVVLQLELPLPVVVATAAGARGLVVLNAAPAVRLPAALLGQVDVLVVNAGEARAVAGAATAREALEALRGRVRRGVVVTLGADGCLVGDAERAVAVPGRPAVVVDTVGAGDAFVAALTKALLDGYPVVEAARIACVAGALTVGRRGARSSPTQAELDEALEDQLGREGPQPGDERLEPDP